MKATIYTTLVLLVGSVIAYMIYTADRKIQFTPSGDFTKDDETLYQLMRKDMMAWLPTVGKFYPGWFDDTALQNYDSGAYTINGIKSKAAAYAAVANIHFDGAKKRYYNQLVSNLKKRYTS